MENSVYNILDLFCGCGGFSLGFEKAGFKSLVAIDNNIKFAKTYKHNFKHSNLTIKDITKFTNREIKNLQETYKFDVILGGPPCQGFSMAGKVGRNFLADDRNFLFKEYVRFLKIIKPKMFVMENVANLKRHNEGKTFDSIISLFENLGYSVKFEVLNTDEYEIPQTRRRLFIVGMQQNIDFVFPKKSNKKITIKSALYELENPNSYNLFTNHLPMKHTSKMLEKMAYIQDGGDRKQIPIHLRPKSGDARKYIRYASNKPAVCVTGDMRKIFHYKLNRALTARELARLQSFDDGFEFIGNSIDIQQQIGNAVPPKLAYKIALEIKKSLDSAAI
ncbi:DNA cytosine methyltransferase [Campylobacter geochelonis]|uniref:DNA cytosine methyltransferase n=1 Tax=Campylobacter geochelonis TaxID=1780362 RepID=UPI000770B26D|nr:DNA cytosine methyltransferase [Campylobacter geochelonis]CZE50298.1 two-component sensor [Campylobacter geochelonis]